ncbi:hypothetical protein Tco_0488741, partial [Tanacetum coccineum]
KHEADQHWSSSSCIALTQSTSFKASATLMKKIPLEMIQKPYEKLLLRAKKFHLDWCSMVHFGGVGDEEVVVGEGLDAEALVEFMVDWGETKKMMIIRRRILFTRRKDQRGKA